MKEWFQKLLSEGDAVSSKRVVGLLGAITLLTMFVITSFSPKAIAASDSLIYSVLGLTLGCFGFTSVDKFVRK